MNHLSSTLVLCVMESTAFGCRRQPDQVVRDVLQLFVRRGGRFTVFSQRTPRAVRSIWAVCGSVLLRWCAAVPWPTIFPMAPASRCAPLPAGCRTVRPPAGGIFINRELSWLDFDSRVLALAKEKTVPLGERIKFAAIFGSNMDEFFMVRVGSLYDQTLLKNNKTDNVTHMTAAEQIAAITPARGGTAGKVR